MTRYMPRRASLAIVRKNAGAALRLAGRAGAAQANDGAPASVASKAPLRVAAVGHLRALRTVILSGGEL
jgi:hypothetical protein